VVEYADSEKSRYTEMSLRYCHHKSHMHWPGIVPGPPLWQTDDKLFQPYLREPNSLKCEKYVKQMTLAGRNIR